MKSVLAVVCVLGVLQNVCSQAIGIVNGGCGCNGNLGVIGDAFGNGLNGINLGLGNEIITANLGSGYGINNLGINNIAGTSTSGYGDVALVGELPIVGSTAVTGNLPVIGYVTFEGTLPAGGLVSLLNNGNCGCSFS